MYLFQTGVESVAGITQRVRSTVADCKSSKTGATATLLSYLKAPPG